jgi:hypothetical protein
MSFYIPNTQPINLILWPMPGARSFVECLGNEQLSSEEGKV